MKGILNPYKIFLSHKNIDGKAAPSTVLLKEKLDKKFFFHVFFDKHEKEMEEFPSYIKNAIFNSDVYILKIPDNGNVDFLLDETNWVYKEIKYALLQKVINPKYKIIPVSFNSKFLWDSSGVNLDKDIEKIRDYNICYLDSDERNFESKIYDRIGFSLKNAVNTKLLLIICAILLLIAACVGYFGYDAYKKRKTIEDIVVIQSTITDEYSRFKQHDTEVIGKDTSLNSLYTSIDSLFIIANSLIDKAPKREISGDFLSLQDAGRFVVCFMEFYELSIRVTKSINELQLSTSLSMIVLGLSNSIDSLSLAQFNAAHRGLNKVSDEAERATKDFEKNLKEIAVDVKNKSKWDNKSSMYNASYFYYNVEMWNFIEIILVKSVASFEFLSTYNE